jgi:hypothetical protein
MFRFQGLPAGIMIIRMIDEIEGDIYEYLNELKRIRMNS